MNIYNIILNTWTTVVSSTYVVPSKRKSACMAFRLPYAYIYGGVDANGVQGDLWRFNFGNNTYSKISEFDPTTNAYCMADEEKFKVIGGLAKYGRQSEVAFLYNFYSGNWEYYNQSSIASSEGLSLLSVDFEFFLGGHNEYNYLSRFSYYYDFQDSIKKKTNDLIYLPGYTYFNTSIYYFGGGYYLSEYLIFSYLPMPSFGKVDMTNVCRSLGCKVQCSKGFYMENKICKICPPGTYAEGIGNLECTKCPKGCYNPYEGAGSLRQCYPCKEGAFNDKLGARFCKICPPNHYCPAGSQKIYDLENNKNLVVSIQPKIYESSYSSQWTVIFQLLGYGSICCVLIAAFCFQKLKNIVRRIDYFNTSHNYKIGDRIQIQNTFTGGQFTIILIGSGFIIFVSICVVYLLDNITEVKTLMPLVILENYAESFKANIDVNFELKNYGDSCIENQTFFRTQLYSTHCSTNIYAVANNIDKASSTLKCYKNTDNTCIVGYHCTDCEINLDSNLKLTLIEKLSYATGILVNVTSDSSIPESSSTVAMQISPDAGNIFIGPSPTEFYFTMTPSYFETTLSNFPSKLTGYHVSSVSSPKPGSQNMIEDISIATQLSVKLNFFRASTGLYTSRYEKQSLLMLISGLFGILSGLTGLVGLVMCQFENIIIKKKDIPLKKKGLKSIIINGKICMMNFGFYNVENNNRCLESEPNAKNPESTEFSLRSQIKRFDLINPI
ncbi:hypothetical protein SteCoe_37232 [Stentor coeruleus]|uniref:Tyrosine-protein kinase ephrin type A/B receptor-like domain-containing protein n=1 Tax=Stentor coeruleus TaxID=5963 RepID=A0A1R2ANS3_9CILI|nr:hypothetical protein SteCoe_37232 [Stentor coeruleus]